jgi:hypothetical protein
MGLDFAIDALYETGWRADVLVEPRSGGASDSEMLARHVDGRVYPTETCIQNFFAEQGYELGVRHIQLFDCYRAEWRSRTGEASGAVVGQTAAEAAVYAMSQLRRKIEPVNIGMLPAISLEQTASV